MVFHGFSTQPTSTTTVFFGQIRVESRTSSGRGGFSVSQCEAGEPRDRRTVHWWRCMTMHVWSTFLREMTMLIILGPCRANPEFRLFLRCRFCRNWADLRVQKGPPHREFSMALWRWITLMNPYLAANGMIPGDWCVYIVCEAKTLCICRFFLSLWRF